MSSGFIYVVQEPQYAKTNIYKIGQTGNLKQRINAYPKYTELLYYQNCKNPKTLEKVILCYLKTQFCQHVDGRERFQGNLHSIIAIIKQLILYNAKKQDFQLLITNFGYSVILCKNSCNIILKKSDKNNFNKLVNKKIIENNKTYNIANLEFLEKINNTKKKIIVQDFNIFMQLYFADITSEYNSDYINNFTMLRKQEITAYNTFNENKITWILNSNVVLNNTIYGKICKNNTQQHGKFLQIDIGINTSHIITLWKLQKSYYEETYLKWFFPYLLHYTDSNSCEVLNFNYEYLSDITHEKIISYEYLYSLKTPPWENSLCYNEFCKKYNSRLQQCNLYIYTRKLLQIIS